MGARPVIIALVALGIVLGLIAGVYALLTQTEYAPVHVALTGGEQVGNLPEYPQYSTDIQQQFGSPFHPSAVGEAPAEFVLAELYQDLSADADAGLYDSDGHLTVRWQTTTTGCALRLPLAQQHVRQEREPTPTPAPTPTPMWETETKTDGATATTRLITPTPIPTPIPDPEAPPTAVPTRTPTPLVSASTWRHWKGRPVRIAADGLAVIETDQPRAIYGHLLLLTGAGSDPNSMETLARLPFPSPHWQNGQAHIHLTDASSRMALPHDDIQAAYRAAVLELRVEGVPDCQVIRMRWERPAQMVLTALADQPFVEWVGPDDEANPPLLAALVEGASPTAARAEALEVFAQADGGDQRAQRLATSTLPSHIVLPQRCQGPSGSADTDCVRTDAAQYIAFALRQDLAPEDGLSDMRETGSAFNARDSITPASGQDPVVQEIDGAQYQIYITSNAWNAANAFGKEWSLQ